MSEEKTTWDAINELSHQVAALREDFRAATEQPKARHAAESDRLTPEAVRNTTFVVTRLRPGYWEEQVDTFLDHVEIEIETLTRERDEARAEAARLRAELGRSVS
ncbi:DivIVA domain-containing protein [Spirillospora sp. CA-255316]